MKGLLLLPYENEIPVFQNKATGSNCRSVPTQTIDLSLTIRALYLYREQLKENIKRASKWKLITPTMSGNLIQSSQQLLEKVNQQILSLEGLSNGRG